MRHRGAPARQIRPAQSVHPVHRLRQLAARRTGITLTVLGLSVALATGGLGAAAALWRDTGQFVPKPLGVGGLSFQAAEVTTTPSPDSSQGGAVTVTLPGKVIASVLDGPTVWQFSVTGAADGIAGLDYTISYPNPAPKSPDEVLTVLEGSTMRVYAAAAGGDCSVIPDPVPTPDATGIVELPGEQGLPAGHYALQEAGSAKGQGAVPSTTQLWCVALAFKSLPDGEHTNIATVTADATNGDTASSFGEFTATIQYPNLLSPLGTHRNIAMAEGLATNGATARSYAEWLATLYPDPDNEPDVTITITPVPTTLATAPTTP